MLIYNKTFPLYCKLNFVKNYANEKFSDLQIKETYST